jgi:hypothetical protein
MPITPNATSAAKTAINQSGVFQPPLVVETVRDERTIRVLVVVFALPVLLVDVGLDVDVVVGAPLACAEFAAAAPLDGLVTGALVAPVDALALEPVALEAEGGVEAPLPEGVKVPVRFQKAEKLLNGPPTTWLDHCSV